MKIKKRWRPYLFAGIMAFPMGFFMSLFLTWVNTGLDSVFLLRWLRAFGVGICIAFPISMIIAPIAHNILNRIVEK